jgi:hypothetical protein
VIRLQRNNIHHPRGLLIAGKVLDGTARTAPRGRHSEVPVVVHDVVRVVSLERGVGGDRRWSVVLVRFDAGMPLLLRRSLRRLPLRWGWLLTGLLVVLLLSLEILNLSETRLSSK